MAMLRDGGALTVFTGLLVPRGCPLPWRETVDREIISYSFTRQRVVLGWTTSPLAGLALRLLPASLPGFGAVPLEPSAFPRGFAGANEHTRAALPAPGEENLIIQRDAVPCC